VLIGGSDELHFLASERRQRFSQGNQFLCGSKNRGANGTVAELDMVVELFEELPLHFRSMNPAGIAGFGGIFHKVVIVEHAPLFSQVQQRDTADTEGDAVQQQHAAQRQFFFLFVVFFDRLFEASEGCHRPGNPHVPGLMVFLKGDAPRERAGKLTGIKVIEEFAMVIGVDSDRLGIGVVKGPANVIVATQVIHPRGIFGQLVAMPECLDQ